MKKLLKILIPAVIVVVIVFAVAEFGTRWYVGNQLKDAYRTQAEANEIELSDDPSINFGVSPVLLGVLSGTINQVTLDSPSTLSIGEGESPSISGAPALHVDAHKIDISDENTVRFGDLVAQVELPDDYLRALLQQGIDNGEDSSLGEGLIANLISITDVTSHPESGTITVGITGGAAEIELSPHTENGEVVFEVTDTSLLGIELPEQATQAISEIIQKQVTEAISRMDLHITDTQVSDGSVTVTVSGQEVVFDRS